MKRLILFDIESDPFRRHPVQGEFWNYLQERHEAACGILLKNIAMNHDGVRG
jgi:hypothetical protein